VTAEDIFLGRVDEQRRWQAALAAAEPAKKDDPQARGSQVVLIHGIGGMGKSRLVRRLLELATASALPPRRRGAARLRTVLVDLESERKRVPDRYPPLEGPSVGTLLYTLERTICEELGNVAEEAFADFRAVLGQVIDVVRDSDRIQQDAKQSGEGLTADEQKGLEKAAGLVGGLLGVAVAGQIVGAGLAVGGTAARVMGGRRAARARRDTAESPRIPQRRIDLALDADRVLVRSFAEGVRQAAGQGRLVLAIDTGEIAAAALSAVRDVAAEGATNVVWLIAGRLDSPATAGYLESTVGEFERSIRSDLLVVIAISVFDRGLQREYLRSRLPDADFTAADLERIDRATRGMPLGLSLVVEMVRDGLSLRILTEVIDAQGEANLLIRGLAERFLYHALRQPEGIRNYLRDDLEAIFALIADETLGSGKVLGYPVQRRIRAALLDVEPQELAGRLDELAARHDFVLASTGQVHEEVAAVIQDYMLGSQQRQRYAAMHERAVRTIADELEKRFGAVPIGIRVNDEGWRLLAAAYVRHTFWISNQRGIAAICALLPAAGVLGADFGRVLRGIATRFYVTATVNEQRVLRGLPWPPASFLEEWLERRRADGDVFSVRDRLREVPNVARGLPEGDAVDCRHAADALAARPPAIAGLTPDEVSNVVVQELMSADLAVQDEDFRRAVDHLRRAHQSLVHDDPPMAAALGSRARIATRRLLTFNDPPRNDRDAMTAAEISARRQVDDPWAHTYLGAAYKYAGRFAEADRSYLEAVRLAPQDPDILGNYALMLDSVGDLGAAEAYYLRALAASPDHANNLSNYAVLLEERGDDELAREFHERAVLSAPNDQNVLANYAKLRCAVGEGPAAQELVDRALQAAESSDRTRLELWMYKFALGSPAQQKQARSEITRLLGEGVRSPDWNFSRIVARAIEVGHDDAEILPLLAAVIAKLADVAELTSWLAGE
jgi:Flp pilus assembly protein TadD